MASGGARGHSGPAPDPNAQRRDRATDGEWTILPARRDGDIPPWPLTDQSAREVELWEIEWRRPQSVMWERNGQHLEVALYVRRLVEVEVPGAATNLGTLVKQMQEALGLSFPGLMRNRWRIAEDETAVKREAKPKARPSAKQRMQVVRDGTEG